MRIQAYNDEFIRAYYGDQDYSFAHESNFRHATEQEIAAGHRIDWCNPRLSRRLHQSELQGEVMRSEFEKAYEPNPHKSPFTEVRFNEEKQIYEPLNPPIDHVARSLNAAWYGYRIRQTEVDELQKRVDDLTQVMEELLEEMKYPTATFEEVICRGVRELEQALKGGSDE